MDLDELKVILAKAELWRERVKSGSPMDGIERVWASHLYPAIDALSDAITEIERLRDVMGTVGMTDWFASRCPPEFVEEWNALLKGGE